jgi:hypothetical protein
MQLSASTFTFGDTMSTRSRLFTLGCTAAAAIALAACATPPRQGFAPAATVKGVAMQFGGSYDASKTDLTLTVNGAPIMRGNFPPYTPTLNLNGNYQGTELRAECYFATILNARTGRIGGIIAGAVQSGQGKVGDECKIISEDKTVVTVNF